MFRLSWFRCRIEQGHRLAVESGLLCCSVTPARVIVASWSSRAATRLRTRQSRTFRDSSLDWSVCPREQRIAYSSQIALCLGPVDPDMYSRRSLVSSLTHLTCDRRGDIFASSCACGACSSFDLFVVVHEYTTGWPLFLCYTARCRRRWPPVSRKSRLRPLGIWDN